MSRLRKAAAALTTSAVVISGLMAASSTPAAAATSPVVGSQFHASWGDYTDTERIAVLDKLALAKVGWVRVDLGWISFQSKGPDAVSSYHTALFDRVVDAANARGIKVLGMIWATPGWANGGQDRSVPPTNFDDYARFAGWMADHYRGRVAAWEIWNEPNHSSFWAGKDPVKYGALVKAAYPAIKAADPNALVVAGATSLNDTTFLARAYDSGMGGNFDVLSTHPYQQPGDLEPEAADNGSIGRLDHLRAVRSMMVDRGDSHKPIWATEFGWSTHANTSTTAGWARGVTEAQQADYTVRALKFVAAHHPYVSNMFVYNERDKASGDIHQDGFGILRRDLTPKPVYTSLRTFLTGAVTEPTTTTTAPAPTTTTTAPAPTTTTTAPAPTTTTTAPAPTTKTASPAPAPAPSVLSYRLVGKDGRTFAFGDTGSLGNTAPLPLQGGRSIVASVATPTGGAWASADDGAVYTIGSAPFYGSMGGTRLNKPIVGMDGTPTGNGYWLVASDGGIFSFGDARFFGSTGGMRLNKPIVGMTATPTGNGYWLVASDGGIFAFGDARFFGSTGGMRLNQPIVGMAPHPTGDGYWLVASDGGIFSFGTAPFLGSTGSIKLNKPITGMVPTPSGAGYWFVASDGGVFSFGDARFLGSAANYGATISGMVAPAR